MSLIVEQLELFYMESILKSLEEEETDARKKKKKKKKKAKKPKMTLDGVKNTDMINLKKEEVEFNEISSTNNTFLNSLTSRQYGYESSVLFPPSILAAY